MIGLADVDTRRWLVVPSATDCFNPATCAILFNDILTAIGESTRCPAYLSRCCYGRDTRGNCHLDISTPRVVRTADRREQLEARFTARSCRRRACKQVNAGCHVDLQLGRLFWGLLYRQYAAASTGSGDHLQLRPRTEASVLKRRSKALTCHGHQRRLAPSSAQLASAWPAPAPPHHSTIC